RPWRSGNSSTSARSAGEGEAAARRLGMLRPRHLAGQRLPREIVRQLAGDECSRSGAGAGVPLSQQLFVRQQARRSGNVQIFRERPRGWQARTWRQDSIEDLATDAAVDLLLQPFACPRIDFNEEASSRRAWKVFTCLEGHTGPFNRSVQVNKAFDATC